MNEVSIVLCGEAGQGIQTVEKIFTGIVKESGFFVFSTKEYMSRVRGGSNSILIRVSSNPVASYLDRIDIFIPLDDKAISHIGNRITDKTYVIGEKKIIKNSKKGKLLEISFIDIAQNIGNKIYTNSVAIGFLSSFFKIDEKVISKVIEKIFLNKNRKIIDENIIAANNGFEIGKKIFQNENISLNINKVLKNSDNIFLNGSESIGLGALAGGCNFISSYPMSPATGVLSFLSKYSEFFDVVVEQAEDEISAINMVLGAWYAGARGMVTTSGGGYALMVEGISLAGMIESPVVVHVGQRPGPATGLPTRTEQADLFHVLYSGHGEFPKLIYAPATLDDGFFLTYNAFNLADKFQIPVFILSDQYFVDSYYSISIPDVDKINNQNYFYKTNKEYKRYKLTSDGISKRGIPGYGDGFICVDSDEHDEDGRITEYMNVRSKMVDKRNRKLIEIEKEIIPPRFIGSKSYKTLVIGWGSTYYTIKEALNQIGDKDISFLHFSQVYPLDKSIIDYFEKADKTIIVENNKSSQFAQLIRKVTGFEIDYSILQYNGLPFSVETIKREISRLIGGN